MAVRASILLACLERWGSSARNVVFFLIGVTTIVFVTSPLAAKQSSERLTTAPIFLLSESSRGSDDVAKAVATALGNPADLRRWTLTFSNRMEPGIRVYANGHDPKAVLDRLGAAGLKAAVIDAPVGVPYSVLTSSKDRIFLIIGPSP